MPAGVTWSVYLRFTAASLLSMFAGAQVVHIYYRPLDEMDKLVEMEVKKLRQELAEAVESGQIKPGNLR